MGHSSFLTMTKHTEMAAKKNSVTSHVIYSKYLPLVMKHIKGIVSMVLAYK